LIHSPSQAKQHSGSGFMLPMCMRQTRSTHVGSRHLWASSPLSPWHSMQTSCTVGTVFGFACKGHVNQLGSSAKKHEKTRINSVRDMRGEVFDGFDNSHDLLIRQGCCWFQVCLWIWLGIELTQRLPRSPQVSTHDPRS
jgi:hypothetical protein